MTEVYSRTYGFTVDVREIFGGDFPGWRVYVTSLLHGDSAPVSYFMLFPPHHRPTAKEITNVVQLALEHWRET